MGTLEAERRMKRVVLVIIAAGFAWLAVSFWFTRHLEVYLPLVWPPVMAVTSLHCLALAVRPTDLYLLRFTGALGVTALASRVAAVVLNEVYGDVFASTWRAVIVAVIWLFAAYGLHVTWRYEIGPWAASERLLSGKR